MAILKCAWYKAYDLYKQTAVARFLNYKGSGYKHLRPITRTGTVLTLAHDATDGDRCFDIMGDDSVRWHCEVTPCQPDFLRCVAGGLRIGDRVTISGTETFDPDHQLPGKQFPGGKTEIHPVTGIDLLS